MVPRQWLVVLLVLLAPSVQAHVYEEHGTITVTTAGRASEPALREVIALVESTAFVVIPNGVLWYVVHGVQAGDQFTLKADDGQEPFFFYLLCGDLYDDCCDHPEDPLHVVRCNYHPDFDVMFTDGDYASEPGDEEGTVPADGGAIVTLFFGDVGEGFSYAEAS